MTYLGDTEALAYMLQDLCNDAKETFDLAHKVNEENKQESEACRELVSRASAALYYTTKALESAVQALREEKPGLGKNFTPDVEPEVLEAIARDIAENGPPLYKRSKGKCPTSCDDDCQADCHKEHQVAAKRTHLAADCPSRKRSKVKA